MSISAQYLSLNLEFTELWDYVIVLTRDKASPPMCLPPGLLPERQIVTWWTWRSECGWRRAGAQGRSC